MVKAIGVLELQGGFEAHHAVLRNLGLKTLGVKSKRDFNTIEGLIIPGGESTTMNLLINKYNLRESILKLSKSFPILGTCAGLILMSSHVDDSDIFPLGILNISVSRNAYGRQIMSKKVVETFQLLGKKIKLPVTLIRAPKIYELSKNINILGSYMSEPIAIIEDNFLGLSFHPELDDISIFHEMMFDKNSKYYYKNIKKKNAA